MLHNSPYTQPTSSVFFFSLFYLTNVMYVTPHSWTASNSAFSAAVVS